MDWLQNHPALIILGVVASLVTIGGAIGGAIKFIPAVSRFKKNVAERLLPSGREKRWMDCRYCEGKGRYVQSKNIVGCTHSKCSYCRGRGQILTDRWDQPDCRYCEGRALVVVKRNMEGTNYEPCDVCSATGKQPFES